MPRVPGTVQYLLNYCTEHALVWQVAPASLGLTPAMVTNFKTLTSDATAAVSTQTAAKDTAKSSTVTANKRVSTLRTSTSAMVRAITTFAEASADPDAVYAAAQIPPPAERSPSLPPGQPENITATLSSQGEITLKWKCTNPPGGNVVYSVTRRSGSTGAFTQVGICGKRSFTDATIPAGSTTVQYVIRAYRGQTVGPASATFTLQFGQEGPGLTISASFTEGAAEKKRAA